MKLQTPACLQSFPSVISVVRAGADRVDELEPLWRALYDHHAAVGRGVAPVRDFADTWRRRRAQYKQWLAAGEGVLLVAQREARALGYAMVRPVPGAATWDLGETGLEIETLSVLPEERRAGVGHALIEAAVGLGQELGAQFMDVGLVYTNEGAYRFYEREGFRRFYVSMVRQLST
jgi:ribosomal protein S18 acetylase RimI-like enzyme